MQSISGLSTTVSSSKNQENNDINVPSFNKATSKGETVKQENYHKPAQSRCGCVKTTPKGAYRDVIVEMPDGRTVYFYHQTPVVMETSNGHTRITSGGYKTKTTKERINRHLPKGYRLYQEDYTWYLRTPESDSPDEFKDGMIIEKEARIAHAL